MRGLGRAALAHPRVADLASADATVARWMRFEAALARASAAVGVVPPDAAEAIDEACRQAPDAHDLAAAAAVDGTPVIALTRWLRERVPDGARRHVHRGATSQDVLDTAAVLLLRDVVEVMSGDLARLADVAARLAATHRDTATLGRTLLQQAVPIPFGLKAARWSAWADRRRARLHEHRARDLVLQFGGAAGSLSALGEHGRAVAEALGDELGLPVPTLPWHAERDRIADCCATLGVTAAGAASIAADLVLMAQGEVAEALPGQAGGSSAMPHKRNPVDAIFARSAARLAVAAAGVVSSAEHEHERAAGAWQAEWVAVPDLACYAAGAVRRTAAALEGLQVDAERMLANLEKAQGLPLAASLQAALAEHLGRADASALVDRAAQRVARSGRALAEVVADDPDIVDVLGRDGVAAVFDVATAIEPGATMVDGFLATRRSDSSPGDERR